MIQQYSSSSPDSLKLFAVFDTQWYQQFGLWLAGAALVLLVPYGYFQSAELAAAIKHRDYSMLSIFCAPAVIACAGWARSRFLARPRDQYKSVAAAVGSVAITLDRSGVIGPHGKLMIPLERITGFSLGRSVAVAGTSRLTLYWNAAGGRRIKRTLPFDTGSTGEQDVRAWMHRHGVAERSGG